MAHTARRITRATRALTAYENDAFPGKPSLLQRDTFYTEALLAALVCDLEHYASHHGIAFSAVVSTGRALNAGEVAQDAPYKVGDQVRLTRQHNHCGTVIGWQDTGPNADRSFLIAVPGIPATYAEPGAHLAPAPDFPSVQTIAGTAHHADRAEELYITITSRLADTRQSNWHALEHDRQRLLSALSSWSGVPEPHLHHELASNPAASSAQPADAKAAAADFPSDIDQNLPHPTLHAQALKQRPNYPRPTHTA